MSVCFLELVDRIITDTGDVIAGYDLLFARAKLGQPLNQMPAVDHPDVRLYNERNPGREIPIWVGSGDVVGPSKETFAWDIPAAYLNLDVIGYTCDAFDKTRHRDDERYLTRLGNELFMMEERKMFPFLRCLIYILDIFRQNNVVWGVGRGSSAASLVLYIIGVNRVDPILYDIPIEEFLKPT